MPEAASPTISPALTLTLTLTKQSIPISIHTATLADAAQISSLGATVFTQTFGYSLPPSDLRSYLTTAYTPLSISADILNPSISTLVARSAHSPSHILGFAQLNRASREPCIEDAGYPKPVELQRLYVSTAAHGLGVGRLLVEGIEAIARGEGYETLWLGVWEENGKAQGFYGRMGLEKCGEHEFIMGTCVQMDWIMKKSL